MADPNARLIDDLAETIQHVTRWATAGGCTCPDRTIYAADHRQSCPRTLLMMLADWATNGGEVSTAPTSAEPPQVQARDHDRGGVSRLVQGRHEPSCNDQCGFEFMTRWWVLPTNAGQIAQAPAPTEPHTIKRHVSRSGFTTLLVAAPLHVLPRTVRTRRDGQEVRGSGHDMLGERLLPRPASSRSQASRLVWRRAAGTCPRGSGGSSDRGTKRRCAAGRLP